MKKHPESFKKFGLKLNVEDRIFNTAAGAEEDQFLDRFLTVSDIDLSPVFDGTGTDGKKQLGLKHKVVAF